MTSQMNPPSQDLSLCFCDACTLLVTAFIPFTPVGMDTEGADTHNLSIH